MKNLHQVSIDGRFKPTGKTRHFVGAGAAPTPTKLVIAESKHGYYLLHLNDRGEEITDTFHKSIAEAMKQAEWEFEVPESAWLPCPET